MQESSPSRARVKNLAQRGLHTRQVELVFKDVPSNLRRRSGGSGAD